MTPLAVLCINVLAGFPDQLAHHQRRIYASPAILDVFLNTSDPSIWATIAQLVEPLPKDCHDLDVPLSHPALASLQRIKDTPDFSLVTVLSLPNCVRLRDDDIINLRTLHRLLALDLRGCSISSYALVALSRGLVDDGGPWGLRLLSLHGCPNINNDTLPALVKFPLLSAIDLRFTRCTPTAINAHLSSLGFRPSHNSSLFHPAPLSLAICSLEKMARSAPHPIPLYSCPPHAVFRIHINDLRLPSRSKNTLAVGNSSHPNPKVNSSVAPVAPLDRPTHPASNASSFYHNAPTQNKYSASKILPFSAQAVQSSEGDRLDPLAIARSPPPWTILEQRTAHLRASSDNADKALSAARWSDKPLNVDRARLLKRRPDAVADLVHQSVKKRLKVESEFALKKTRMAESVKPRNPFTRGIKSVFVESDQSSNDAKPDVQLRPCRSLPSKPAAQQEIMLEKTIRPLKPITTLKPPILPRELLPTPRHTSKPKTESKQARLSFS